MVDEDGVVSQKARLEGKVSWRNQKSQKSQTELSGRGAVAGKVIRQGNTESRDRQNKVLYPYMEVAHNGRKQLEYLLAL